MSLLNEVLRDLDARTHASEEVELKRAADPQPIPAGSLPIATERDWTRIVAWLLVACALVVWVLVMWVLPQVGKDPAPSVSNPWAAQPLTIPPNATAVKKPAAPQLSPNLEQSSAKPVAAVLKPKEAKPVDPKPIDPEPVGAAIETAVVETGPAMAAQQASTQQASISPAIKTESPKVAETQSEPAPLATTPAQVAEAITTTPPVAMIKQPAQSEPVVTNPPVDTDSSAKTGPLVRDTTRIEISRSQPKAVDIEQLIRRGELSRAEVLLNERLQQQPDDRNAYRLMVGLLLRGGRAQQALQQIDVAQQRLGPIPALELIAARVLIENNDLDRAEQRLLDLLIEAPDERDATRMLAALWHTQQRADEAAALYERLVALPDATMRDWLGLALSSDGRDNATALDAYQRVVNGQGLDASTLRYAQQRIRELKE